MVRVTENAKHHLLRFFGILVIILVFLPLLGLFFNPGFGQRDIPTLLPWTDSPIKQGWDFFVQRDNPVKSLNPLHWEQIKTGQLRNWLDVGGEDQGILLYSQEGDPLSQDISGSFAQTQITLRFGTQKELLDRLQNHPGALALLPSDTQHPGIKSLNFYPYTAILRSATFGGTQRVLPPDLHPPRDLRQEPYPIPESNIGQEIFFISPGNTIPRGWDLAPPWSGGISLGANPLNGPNLGNLLTLLLGALSDSLLVFLVICLVSGILGVITAALFQLRVLPRWLWKFLGRTLQSLSLVPPVILGLIILVFYPWEPPSSDNLLLVIGLGTLLLLPQAFRFTRGVLHPITPKQGREIQALGLEQTDFIGSLILPYIQKNLPQLLSYLLLKTLQLIIPLRIFLSAGVLRALSDGLQAESFESQLLRRLSEGRLDWEMQVILLILLITTLPLFFLEQSSEEHLV